MNNENLKPVQELTPFTKMIMTIGTLPSSFYSSMSYYESMVWLYEYLKNEIIPTVNNNAEAVNELQNLYVQLKEYIDNYFENLDVQEEINNKLDEMAEDGTLAEIIADYVQLKAQLVYNTVSEMKNAENLYNGSFAKTYGFHTYNDGGGALYKIRTITNQDVVDEMTIISLHDETLIAELVIYSSLNVKQLGAYGDGTHDDTIPIQTAINKIKHEYYDKNGGKIVFPVPSKFYKITESIDLTEMWNISVEAEAPYNFQRQSPADIDNDYKLIHWYGSNNTPMIILDYSFSSDLKNISLNGRNIASCGFQVHPTAVQTAGNKFINFYNCLAKYCTIGYDIGETTQATDDCPISLYSCYAMKNSDCGFKINSGNDSVKFFGGMATNNGESPIGDYGTNIYLVSGEVGFFGFTTDGLPTTADIKLTGGGLSLYDFWSDITQGLLLSATGGSSIKRCVLNSVRHFDSNMTNENTPKSIEYNGKAPLVLEGCYLYNNVEVNSGNQAHIIDIGTHFIYSSATFTGTAVNEQHGLISIGTTGQNEARLSVGKPARSDGGGNKPSTFWGFNNKPLAVKTTENFTITEDIVEGGKIYEIIGNAYNDNGTYKSIKAGETYRFLIANGRYSLYTGTTATGANETITFTALSGFAAAEGSPNGNPAIALKTRRINYETSAPASGSHTQGDIVFNQGATAGGVVGWICVSSGSPGTWKSFGTIST